MCAAFSWVVVSWSATNVKIFWLYLEGFCFSLVSPPHSGVGGAYVEYGCCDMANILRCLRPISIRYGKGEGGSTMRLIVVSSFKPAFRTPYAMLPMYSSKFSMKNGGRKILVAVPVNHYYNLSRREVLTSKETPENQGRYIDSQHQLSPAQRA